MKKTFPLLMTLIIVFLGCKKAAFLNDEPDQVLIDEAKMSFANEYGGMQVGATQVNNSNGIKNPRLTNARIAIWDQAQTIRIGSNRMVLVPVKFINNFYLNTNLSGNAMFSASDLSKLCIYRDSVGIFHALWLSFLPDSNYKAGASFMGIVLVDDWRGNPITKYKYDKSGSILQWNGEEVSQQEGKVQTESTTKNGIEIIETCYTIEGYNYSTADPANGYYWTEAAGCSYTYIATQPSPSTGGSPGGSGIGAIGGPGIGSVNPVTTVVIESGSNIIGNIADYFKCFTSGIGPNYSYKVMVCVDQPIPGSRDAWGISEEGSSESANPVKVGHAFFVMTEISPLGTISRNVGFYPQNIVYPLSPTAQGQLNNDANHLYNISLSIQVNNSQFFSILNYIALGNNTGFIYNLNNSNCVTFVLSALDQANIFLSATKGTWFNGSGYDPGDFGEDIRNMSLNSNMIKNTVFNSHPNIGSCP